MKIKSFRMAILFAIVLLPLMLTAQPQQKLIKVNVAPQSSNWLYKLGEKVKFDVNITRNNQDLQAAKIYYEFGLEGIKPVKKDSLILKNGETTIDAGTLKLPGFIRIKVWTIVDGVKYESLGAAGFEPEKIQPTTTLPADFQKFWDAAKTVNAAIPLKTKMTLLPERCTENVNVYEVSVQNFKEGVRLYGIACIPSKPGKYPAVLKVPGAGVRPYYGDVDMAENGIITFEIGIHGISVTQNKEIYDDLKASALSNYHTFNLDNKDNYYYKRVYLGCVRAIDFIYTLPEFDGSKLAVAGGSQGGALAIITAALDNRVKYLSSFYPALCDLTGYLNGRVGGWPHVFEEAYPEHRIREKIETSKYYDVVNFARFVKVPGFYSWGYNDHVCPPTTTYSAYNVITAPKQLEIYQEIGHWTFPEQNKKAKEWLLSKLLK